MTEATAIRRNDRAPGGMRVVVIDNYDSFTFNLVQFLGDLGAPPLVYRNDALTAPALADLQPTHVVISPGPGRPEDAGIAMEAIRTLASRVAVLGVCLGHQAICAAFGARIVRAGRPMHGKASSIVHDRAGIFHGVPVPFEAGRYHSLVAAPDPWPADLEVAARAEDDGAIMAVRHRTWRVHGVQFHPESLLTTMGRRILENFLER